MLNMNVSVNKGIMFFNLEGNLTNDTFFELEDALNYLLYKQGMQYFVFNFSDLDRVDLDVINNFKSKLTEIFLCCGKVAVCGVNKILKNFFGSRDNFFYINNQMEAFKYLSI